MHAYARNLHLEYNMLSQHKPATLHTGAKLVLEQPILNLTFSSSLNLRAWLIQSHASSKIPTSAACLIAGSCSPNSSSESVLTQSPLVLS